MKLKSRCEKCNSNLNSKKILESLKKENKQHLLCKIKCPKCEHYTQVLDKPIGE